MRVVLLVIAFGLLVVNSGGIARPSAAKPYAAKPSAPTVNVATTSSPADASPAKPRIDFETQLKPIFQSKCMPCHFSGGQMYDRLPFDKPATIRRLGVKLFTRIKDENQRRLIEDFLAQSP